MQKHFDKAQCRQKGISTLIGILIIVVASVILFGGVFAYQYFATKNNDQLQVQSQQQVTNQQTNNNQPTNQIAGWKTYTNTQYGFEIKYPDGWDNKIGGQGKMGEFSLLSLDINKNSSDFNLNRTPYVRLVVENENFRLGTRDWKKFELGQIRGNISYSATVYEIVFVSSQGQNFYITTKNNPETDNITKQILSTFKFTTPIDQTAGWKTYTNTQYGYEIKYPKDWSISTSSGGLGIYCNFQNGDKKCEGLENVGIGVPGPGIGITVKQVSFADFTKDYVVNNKEYYLLDGATGWKFSGGPVISVGSSDYIFATKNSNSYIITYVSMAPIQNQIISTFKFTK
jgi:hypothetical protein